MKKIKIILIIIAISVGLILYIERSHLGYFEYQYYKLTNAETGRLEDRLIVVLKNDPDQLFVEFRKGVERHPQNLNVCHGIAHKLGHESYELYGFERSMQMAQSYCGAGFIHGLLESKLSSFTDTDDISKLCKEKDEKCNHGIGHGLMVLTKNDFKEALTRCDTLLPGARSDCYDGVFMHIFDDEETGVSKDIPERAEGAGLCSRVDVAYKKSCYFYVPRIYVNDQNMNTESNDLCQKIKGDYKKVCVFGSGVMFGKYIFSDEDKANSECTVFGKDAPLCKEGVALYRDIVF